MDNKNIKIKSVEMDEGEGARVKRLFPTNNYDRHHDPFVLMDEFFVSPPSGFPTHEHRGFEAITYMLEGSFRHEDNQGNKAEVGPGGVQAFNAGKSIRHSEAPGEEKLSHGIQLWINLPADEKQSEPEYQQIMGKDINEIHNDGITVRTIAGDNSNLKLHTDLIYKDISISASNEYNFNLPDNYTGIIYVIEGKLISDSQTLSAGQGLLVNNLDDLKYKTEKDTRIIELKGIPHGNKIRIKGSFVE